MCSWVHILKLFPIIIQEHFSSLYSGPLFRLFWKCFIQVAHLSSAVSDLEFSSLIMNGNWSLKEKIIIFLNNATGIHCLNLGKKWNPIIFFSKLLKCLSFENRGGEKQITIQFNSVFKYLWSHLWHYSIIIGVTWKKSPKSSLLVFSRQMWNLTRHALWV